MESEGVSLPRFHEHPMVPCNDLKKGDCCRRFKTNSDGYYCESCDFFVHKKCVEAPEYIQHPSHPIHFLRLSQSKPGLNCHLCGKKICENTPCYRCEICDFDIDLCCAEYPPPEFIDISETHRHKLILLKESLWFRCGMKCGKESEMYYCFPYQCHKCEKSYYVDSNFHVECALRSVPPQSLLDLRTLELKPPLVVRHSYHSLHPLKLLKGQSLPVYSDGKCRLCEREVDDNLFYHCSSCNFTLDMRCAFHPPPRSLLNRKTHDHQLSLLPRLDSFTCNACGLKGDRSPYICVQCDFFIHQDCVGLPRVININRHYHRVSRIPLIGAVNSVCGVCRKKVDWTHGGYSCQQCPSYVVHSKCATRKDVWNGKELEGVREQREDLKTYKMIDFVTIQHFSHEEHYLKRKFRGLTWEDNRRCDACTHPISIHSFYSCMDCDFYLHETCAELPKKIRHVLHNDQLTLHTNRNYEVSCVACKRWSNGFLYHHGDMLLDVRCGSISEPSVHPSHPHHPLYYVSADEVGICNGCNKSEYYMLRCIEDGCGFVLGFKCATLPQMVKHRVENHPLSLCYGEEASGKNWCDICEKEINLETWFYTCKDHRASLHTKCVLGDLSEFLPKSTVEIQSKSYEVVLNNSVTRPLCRGCKSRCLYPITLKMLDVSDSYVCSHDCLDQFIKK